MTSKFSGKVFGLFDAPVNKKRIAELEALGAEVMRFPEVSIERAEDETVIIAAIKNLKSFDWIFFSDIWAVETFLEILDENEIDTFELDELVVCAFGEAVADRLRFVQVHSDVVPSKLVDEIIFETVQNFVTEPGELSTLKVVFIRKAGGKSGIATRLRRKVANVNEVEIYRTSGIAALEMTRLKTLLKSGAIDDFAFCSVEDVQNLVYIVYPETLSEILIDMKISAADPLTFQALREHSINPQLVTELPSSDD